MKKNIPFTPNEQFIDDYLFIDHYFLKSFLKKYID